MVLDRPRVEFEEGYMSLKYMCILLYVKHIWCNTFSFALFDINKYFLLSKHIEQEPWFMCQPGIEPGST